MFGVRTPTASFIPCSCIRVLITSEQNGREGTICGQDWVEVARTTAHLHADGAPTF